MIGKIIKDRYEVLEKIGEGGMGVVYKAIDKTLQRPVAIKMLHPAHSNEMLRTRFQVEALVTARLNHHSIVTLYDFFEEGEKHFLVMELLEGKTGKDLLDENESIPFPMLLRIFLSVIEGLAYAHRHGIIHRDIKPNNIMIMDSGEVKLMDFGIARSTDSPHMTQVGFTVGSALYMSPEQIKNQQVDNRSDIYSLGITMFEMATGVAPFQDPNSSEYNILLGHLTTDLPSPAGINPDIPDYLEKAIIKATQKNPDDRFQTMEELGGALEPDLAETRVKPTLSVLTPKSAVKKEEPKAPVRGFLSKLPHVSIPLAVIVLAGIALITVLAVRWFGESEDGVKTPRDQITGITTPRPTTPRPTTPPVTSPPATSPPATSPPATSPPTVPPVVVPPEPVKPPAPAVKIAKFKAISIAKGSRAPAEVKDGDTLTSEDRYFVVFSADEVLQVYMAQVDDADMITPIFPNPQFSAKSNPLRPRADHRFPEKEYFFLGGGTGKERLYVIASRGPIERLDHIYAELMKADDARTKQLSREFIDIFNQQEQNSVRTIWFWHG